MSVSPDAWSSWKKFTGARIALGRTGGSLPTREWLDFSLAHARAQDAVHLSLDVSSIQRQLDQISEPHLCVRSTARDRTDYLQYPDHGRTLHPDDFQHLTKLRRNDTPYDVVVIIADGLSAPAANLHAVPLLSRLLPRLRNAGWTNTPIIIAEQARVALQDDIGHALNTRLSLILLGERPGLSSPDSLGAYLTYNPQRGRHDAERNCVSNIRPEGLPISEAASTLEYLLINAHARRITGIHLKDDRNLNASPSPPTPIVLSTGESKRSSPDEKSG